jgi:FemAB family protein
VKSCLDLAEAIAKAADLGVWSSAESFSESMGLSDWHTEAMARDADCAVRHDLFLDLHPDMAEIKRNIRSSYKSLITGGMRTWSVGVLDSLDESIWDEFRRLHLRVSGRKTRSDETWALQHEDIGNRNAFLVHLRNSNGEMVGGGLFNFTRDEGAYAVGVYDRSLFDKPLGHVVQYRAIEELKSRGVRWYKIGARPFSSEMPTPTDKEISIGEFKQGFASHVFPQYRLTHKV